MNSHAPAKPPLSLPVLGVSVRSALIVLTMLLFTIVFVRNAWVSDDAFITLRTVSNAAKGYGLTWNTFERVQAYTHPLWMFLLLGAHLVTGEYFYTTVALSLLCSALAVYRVLFHVATPGQPWLALPVLTLLLSSKAFIDFSSSGLENPLVFLLLVIWWLTLRSEKDEPAKKLFAVSFFCALLYITRPDSVVLVMPAALWVLWSSPPELGWGTRIRLIIVGALPLILWTIFSLVYYGFPFPNTAYAKLGTGIEKWSLIEQGWRYCLNSLRWDPITLPVITLGSLVAVLRGSALQRAAALGALGYVAYTVQVGGDFMSGRFFAAPFFLTVMLLTEFGRALPARICILTALFILATTLLLHPRPPFLAGASYAPLGIERSSRIADERGHYYRDLGLLPYFERDQSTRRGTLIMHRAYQAGLRARIERRELSRREAIGMFGFAAGKDVRVIDVYALSDPLLARLPAVNRERWRIGHFTRRVPPGYDESVRTGQNVIEDPDLHTYYEKLRIITQGPIWSSDRFQTIVAMNLGRYEHLVAQYLARVP